MTRRPLQITVERTYDADPDGTAEIAAWIGLIQYSRANKLAERYPTPEPVVKAIAEREAHYRGCPTCAHGGDDGMCGDGVRLSDVADRALADMTAVRTAQPRGRAQ